MHEVLKNAFALKRVGHFRVKLHTVQMALYKLQQTIATLGALFI
jgi:hypothetical protein